MIYLIARKFWTISKLLWLTLISLFLITFFANLLVVQVKDLSATILVSVLHWFALLRPIQIFILFAIGLFSTLTFCSFIFVTIENVRNGGEPRRKYLLHVIGDNNKLNPIGIYQQSQALISVNVPLDTNFIHLQAMPDRPRYDMPSEQQRLLQEILQNPNLNEEEREEQMQHLRGIWFYSPHEQSLPDVDRKREVEIEEVIRRLKATSPVAIILGTPGSGKTTTLRWLALHMAFAALSWFYHLPDGLSPKQFPILLRISDYAKQLDTEDLSFEEYFNRRLVRIHPQLPSLFMNKLKKGRCLLLFDGLDEVANDSLRRRVAKNIYDFIFDYSTGNPSKKHFNRFMITSRIVGYEEGSFNAYDHYTLLELTDEQIDRFLTTWCPAVERHMARSAERSKELSTLQKMQADEAGSEQTKLLLNTLKSSPGIRRLAVNPLMLTILALIQRNGKTLPHRRVDLYQIVTRTLLDNWNQGTGREALNVNLAEQTLSDLAYHIHCSDHLCTEQDVKNIVRRSMSEFYERDLTKSDDDTVETFIETIRRTSGVFVETGQGLFSFMHRTFQEYYVARYLIHMAPVELRTFAVNYCRSAIWHEPLLLAIADKSGYDKEETSTLIEAIVDKNDDYDRFLHRNLLFAVNSMIDCEVWSIKKELQKRLANQLFDLYGDILGAGRYTQLQEGIEQASLLWLRGQPQRSNTTPPLVETWREALCNEANPVRQEGAAHLLASIGLDLEACPTSVLSALLPPLLKLADLQDFPCPSPIKAQLSHIAAHPTSQRVAEYAFVTLNLLDAAGPAGWLRDEWLKWSEEQPELLDRLTQHSRELGFLLTPSTLPSQDYDSNWASSFEINDALFKTCNRWKEIAQNNPGELQNQLLYASNTVRYPHAYLLKQLLEREMASSSTGQPWYVIWDTFLQEEMAHARNATYHACLNLRLVLCQANKERRQELAKNLMVALSSNSQEQTQALITITYIYHILDMGETRDLRKMRNSRAFFYLPDLRCLLYLLHLQYLRYQRDIREDWGNIQVWLQQDWLLDRAFIVENLCKILEQRRDITSIVLLAFLSILFNSSRSSFDRRQIQKSIQQFKRQAQPLTTEYSLLTTAVLRGTREVFQATSAMPHEIEEPHVKAVIQLLQENKTVPWDVREIAAQKIMNILNDPMLSLSPIERPSDDRDPWRLDDMLFEILQRLAEQAQAEHAFPK